MEHIYDERRLPGTPPDEDEAAAQACIAPSFVHELRHSPRKHSSSLGEMDNFGVGATRQEDTEHTPILTGRFDASKTHAASCLANMAALRDELCDVELQVEEKSIKAQRAVLAACSMYFKCMFSSVGAYAESSRKIVEIRDLKYEYVRAIVEFFYTSEIEITIANVEQLMMTASILQVDSVQAACARYMFGHIDVANCLSILQFAMMFNCKDLEHAAYTFAANNFCAIKELSEFLDQPIKVVKSLLASSQLAVETEEDVYKVALRWVQHDAAERQQHFASLLKEIRLWQLSLPFLAETVSTCDLVRNSLECRDLVDAAKHYHLLPEMRERLKLKEARPCTIGVLYVVGGMNNLGLPVERVEKHALEYHCYQSQSRVSSSCDDKPPKCHSEGCTAESCKLRFEAPPLNMARSGLSVAIIENKLYAIGGHLPGNHGPENNGYLNSVECYNPESRKWTFVASMKHARRYVAVTSLDNRLYAIGGCNAREVLDVAECYNPDLDQWTDCAGMRIPRRHAGASSLGKNVFVVGGHDGNSYLRSVEAYSPEADRWSNICSMAGRRGGLGVATVENRLYAVGGYNGSKNLSTVEYLEDDGSSWKMAVPMKTCRSGLAATCAGGRLLVVGGHCGSSYLETTEWFEPRSGVWQPGPRLSLSRAVTGVAVFTAGTAAMELQNCAVQELTADDLDSWNSGWKMKFTLTKGSQVEECDPSDYLHHSRH